MSKSNIQSNDVKTIDHPYRWNPKFVCCPKCPECHKAMVWNEDAGLCACVCGVGIHVV